MNTPLPPPPTADTVYTNPGSVREAKRQGGAVVALWTTAVAIAEAQKRGLLWEVGKIVPIG